MNQGNSLSKLQEQLKAAKNRRPDAYAIIGAVSTLGEGRVEEIANGTGKPPTFIEQTQLEVLTRG